MTMMATGNDNDDIDDDDNNDDDDDDDNNDNDDDDNDDNDDDDNVNIDVIKDDNDNGMKTMRWRRGQMYDDDAMAMGGQPHAERSQAQHHPSEATINLC